MKLNMKGLDQPISMSSGLTVLHTLVDVQSWHDSYNSAVPKSTLNWMLQYVTSLDNKIFFLFLHKYICWMRSDSNDCCIGLDKGGYPVNLHENICCGYSLEAPL